MADIHNALKRGPWGSALSRAVGLSQGSNPLERVGETLTPVMDLWDRPDWSYLRREWLLALSVAVSAVAGEFSGFAITNPLGSGVLATVETIYCRSGSQLLFNFSRALASVAAATYGTSQGRGISRDSRNATTMLSPGVCELIYGSDAGAVGAVFDLTCQGANAAMTPLPSCLPYIVSPGEALIVAAGTVNTAVQFSVGWRERKAQPGELE